jgi:hypothetical protein
VGRAVWKDTKVEIPADLGVNFQNIFTDTPGVCNRQSGKIFLSLAEGLSCFPVALMEFSESKSAPTKIAGEKGFFN